MAKSKNPMIEDEELRDLFQVECEEHLQLLDSALLHLEKVPGDPTTLEEMFRAAHSLKGTARMLGVLGVERIAHQMEDELDRVRRGRATLTPAHLDRYAIGLSAMQKLVAEAVSGAPANVNVENVVAQLKEEIGAPEKRDAPLQLIENSEDRIVVFETDSIIVATESTKNETESAIVAANSTKNEEDSANGEQIVLVSPQSVLDERIIVSSEADSTKNEGIQTAIPTFAPLLETVDAPRADSMAIALNAPDSTLSPASETPLTVAVAPRTSAQTSILDSMEASPRVADEFKIQTMRVAPAKLDALMTLSSELSVTSTRVIRGMTAWDEIGALCEEWSKDLAPGRPLWRGADIAAGEIAKHLNAFQTREQTRLARLQGLWETLQQVAYQDVTRLGLLSDELEEGIRSVRLLPLSQVFGLFPRLVRDLARELGKEIDFRIDGGEVAVDKRILEEIKDPLMHMLRNALDHGIARPDERLAQGKPRVASLHLRATQSANSVVIELQDDGRGLNVAAIKRTALARGLHSQSELDAMTVSQIHLLIFAPGFSTSTIITDLSGRGVGLDVVAVNIERLKGSLEVHSEPGRGTTFSIRLPLTLATSRVLLVGAAGRTFALPVESIQSILRVEKSQIFSVEGRRTTVFEGRALPLAPLSSLLELESEANAAETTVVLGSGDARLGVQVESLIDEQEVMLKPLGALLKRVRNVSGVTILGAGEVCLVLHVGDLIKSAQRRPASVENALPLAEADAAPPRKVILLAEDSITTRTQEKRILEGAGYEVVTAVDGADAFAKLGARDFDGVVSDVEMPNMDGLTLAARIRQNPRYSEMPIILVTSLSSDDDKRRGVEIGANAYITKGTFEQKILIDTLRRLV